MRCLYCGKELALLKRLTGGGEFCSEAHKQSYQEEYNRLALSRLLQAQKKGKATAPAQSAAPPAAAVAVEESAPDPQPESAGAELEQPTAEALAAEPPHDAGPGASAGPEPRAIAELDPREPAGFLPELLAVVASAEQIPYQESWVELALSPALLQWQAENPVSFELSEANLQALDCALNSASIGPSIEDRTPSVDLPAQAWPSTPPNPIVSSPVSPAATWNRTAANRLGFGGAVALQVPPVSGDPASDQTFVHPVPFESAILFSQSEFLELAPTSINFPAADADVVVLERSREAGPVEDTTPRSSLEALSRLHQEMIEQREAQPPLEAAAPPVESTAAAPEVVAAPSQDSPVEERAVAPVTIDIVADNVAAPNVVMANVVMDDPEQAQQESRPASSTDILEVSLRIFPPSKGMPRAGELLPAPTAPLLPHLKGLPLRPKVALARGYAPGAPASAETPATAAVPQRKPVPRPLPAKPSAPPAKPAQSVAAKSAAVKEAVKPAAPPAPSPQPAPVAEVAKADAPPIEKASPAQPAPAIQEVKVQEVKAQEVKVQQVKVQEVKKSEPLIKTVEEPAKSESPKSPSVRPEPLRVEPARSRSGMQENVPNFGIAQPANVQWYGSLKVKLGIAILLLLIACIYFLGWGSGKSHPSASSNSASGDGSGPSIMLGEGGWVEGWGGDPAGLHVGRQITIYRPSLKLSDYRIQFQANIDVKSIGWVFRAADPENYYAMKIAAVSSALPLKVALFKYLVANGRQTQVGRVPIDMSIQPDTTFIIREDVRGPHFTTYIQGQQIDSWTDDQLKIGGVGFLNEREERGKVSSVSIRYLTGGK